jgi:hypothetical protein
MERLNGLYQVKQIVLAACAMFGAALIGTPAAAQTKLPVIVVQPYYPQPYPYQYPYRHEHVVSVPSYYADLPTDYYGYGYYQSYYHALVQPYEGYYRPYWGHYTTPTPELYGDDPAAYGYPYGNGYNTGPYAYAGGYFQQVPTSSSICWEPIRGRIPCNAGP